jgi:hypothetical protein
MERLPACFTVTLLSVVVCEWTYKQKCYDLVRDYGTRLSPTIVMVLQKPMGE